MQSAFLILSDEHRKSAGSEMAESREEASASWYFDIFSHLLYNEFGYPGMYRFRQKILGHKQRVGIPSTPLNGGKT